MSLKEWVNSGILREERTSQNEIHDLLKTIDRELINLKSAKDIDFSLDTIFRFAYNVARQCARLALRASGCRVPGSQGAHYWTLQSLRHTLNVDAITVEKLEKFRAKRNLVEYVQADIVSQTEVDEMIDTAVTLFKNTKAWLKENHPDLLKDDD